MCVAILALASQSTFTTDRADRHCILLFSPTRAQKKRGAEVDILPVSGQNTAMASVRPNAGSTGDLLRLRVMDPMDMESGGQGVNPTLARSFPAKKGASMVRTTAVLSL